ncbi:MAG: L-carnitine dehydratase/bile acid-inducible protein [Ramlibacter sp.]|nr:L-carnitine dehydratase/bile acid-inducible protein [Ramlibacter sp.]
MGPLQDVTVIELAGIGPSPLAAMMLADMGADVIRVERLKPAALDTLVEGRFAVHNRNRRSIALNLQRPEGVEVVLRLAKTADILMEPFRPGVAEKLGVGPEPCLAVNPRLVYARMTGWGQQGPLARAVGHDINYIAVTGALDAIGRRGQKPVAPLNLVGDMGGGGMLMAFGMLAALHEARRSGQGQVVDAAMVDGTALMLGSVSGLQAGGFWHDERGTNFIDGGAHFYDVYRTSDGKFVSIGSLEPQFYGQLLGKLGLDAAELPPQMDEASWPAMAARFEEIFLRKTRDEWCAILEGSDLCFAPVLTMAEAPEHPHAKARQAYVDVGGVVQPAPAPRYSRTPAAKPRPPARHGEHTDAVLDSLGYSPDRIASLRAAGVVA